mmetsp:Transcript_2750/g.9676  ORF Transcript_2750/g.9676 Transcript_2750/m.9676 type:complete len:133 (-) Transcript_2750:626-1024(-)
MTAQLEAHAQRHESAVTLFCEQAALPQAVPVKMEAVGVLVFQQLLHFVAALRIAALESKLMAARPMCDTEAVSLPLATLQSAWDLQFHQLECALCECLRRAKPWELPHQVSPGLQAKLHVLHVRQQARRPLC